MPYLPKLNSPKLNSFRFGIKNSKIQFLIGISCFLYSWLNLFLSRMIRIMLFWNGKWLIFLGELKFRIKLEVPVQYWKGLTGKKSREVTCRENQDPKIESHPCRRTKQTQSVLTLLSRALQGAAHHVPLQCLFVCRSVCWSVPPPPWKDHFWAAQAILRNVYF